MDKPYLPVRITAIETLTPTVKRYDLAPVTGELPRFTPGAHIETRLMLGGHIYVRSFSLCGPLDETAAYQIAIRRQANPDSATVRWHEQVQVGTKLEISLPVNQFALSEQARHHLLIAGGIGITPMIPMMEHLYRAGQTFELHYAAPDLAHAAFARALLERYDDAVHLYFSRAGSRMSPAVLEQRPLGTHVYLCGPDAMQRMFYDAALGLGYPRGNVHFERFSRVRHDDDKPFTVTLARQKRTIQVGALDSLLDALLQAGLDVPYSCRAGGCGTCCLPVIEGEVEHRDFFLSDEEKETHQEILPCVSRALTKHLVLDC